MRQVRRRPKLTLEDYQAGLFSGDRVILARAISLIESRRPAHRALASELLEATLSYTSARPAAHRVAISGVPGVGKSSVIERLGLDLIAAGHRVAVLAIDPSSVRSGGSILGDKTRMEQLSAREEAFIRPTPSAGTLGGVAAKTRAVIRLCEAAGFDIILIETVGVGQSEVTAAQLCDSFLALMLSGAGDALQGIKRGLMEVVDLVAVNKADGTNQLPARRAAATYRGALQHLHSGHSGWRPPVLTCSAQSGEGIDKLWETLLEHRRWAEESGAWTRRRAAQRLSWYEEALREGVEERLRSLGLKSDELQRRLEVGSSSPARAAEESLRLLFEKKQSEG